MPNLNPNPMFYDGAVHGDGRKIINQSFEQALVANTTVVQATNPTSAANLMTAVLQAGTLSRVGQTLQVQGFGITNLTSSASTLTIACVLGGITLATIATGSVAAGALNLPWQLNLFCTVVSVDSGGNVVLEVHGSLAQALTTTTAGLTTYNDVNIAASSAVPAFTPMTLALTALLGTGNAASFVNQRQLIVDLYN